MMRRYFGYFVSVFIFCLISGFAGCGGSVGEEGGGGGDDGSNESGDCAGGGWCGDETITVTADLSGARALFTVQDTSSSVLSSESLEEPVSRAAISNQSKFYKLLEDGTSSEILSAQYTDASSVIDSEAYDALPAISFVASSELGDVFIAFEYPWMYRTPDPTYSDPWSPSSPYTCQLFKVQSTLDDAAGDSGLCCITNTLELNTWDFRTSKIQFDSSGNAYFSAHVPQNWKDVLIKWNHSSTPETDENDVCTYSSSSLSEVINANIIYRDWLVVPTGGVFYTGFTSTDGEWNDGDSFLRFRNNGGILQEVVSGWWDYIFQPVEVDDTLEGIDESLISLDVSSSSERVIFYGPDPRIATAPEWEDSCLYLYDPNLEGGERSTEIADCNIDVWQYVEFADDIATRRSRCTETKNMMGGGNQPKKILVANAYDADGNYISSEGYTEADDSKEIIVVGDIYEKKAGEWRFDVCVNENHCTDENNIPDYTNSTNQATCENAGGTWKDYGDCYNHLTDSTFYAAMDSGAAANDTEWQLNGSWCESPGGEWREIYSAMAQVNYIDSETRSIVMLSNDEEIVKDGWAVNDRLYYNAFNVEDGEYHLLEVENNESLLDGYEIYELFKDPNNENKLYFNGLRFEDNSYVMGTLDPDDPVNTLSTETGITGQIETLIIIPDALLQ